MFCTVAKPVTATDSIELGALADWKYQNATTRTMLFEADIKHTLAYDHKQGHLTPRAADSPGSVRFSTLVCGTMPSSLASAVPARRRAADAGR
jgi:hypothetical protein